MPKPADVVTLLEHAAEALDASKPAAALAPLLDAWEKVRSPELAGLVERVSALAGDTAPFPGKTAKARHEAWLALAAARSPHDVERLLASLVDGVKSREAAERLEALGAFPPDPRIAKALVDIAWRPPFRSQGSKPFWKKLFLLVVVHGDPRTIDALGPLAPTYDERVGQEVMGELLKRQLERALADLRERYASPPALPEAASAVFRRVAALVPAPSSAAAQAEDDLLAAIAAAPDEDGPRLVYADLLQEQGNPRGEFITLQFQRGRAGGLSPKEKAREAALLAKHKRDWLGPFYSPLTRTWNPDFFRRGFLAVASFGGANPADIEDCAGDVRWTTVEELFLPSARYFSCAPLFEAPVFGALRTLRGAALDVVATLLRTGVAPRLETLRCSQLDRGAAEGLLALSHLRSLAVAPVAEEPRPSARDYAWMLELAVMDQLTRFDVSVDPGDKTLAPLAVASDARPDLALEVDWYATLVFARGADGRRSALALELEPFKYQTTLVARYAPLLESIPASSIRRVRVTGAERGTRAALAPLLARFDEAKIVFG
jgi:uncharacterized protein (TIGR02996 family)